MLNIKTANDPIDLKGLTTVIYGQPGTGKTTLGYTSGKQSLLINFDTGEYRAVSNVRTNYITPKFWEEVANFKEEDLQNFDSIVIDTAGKMLDLISVSLAKDPKNVQKNGQLTMQGWGALKQTYVTWTKKLNALGKDIVIIAHEKETKDGDNTTVRPDIQGGAYGEVFKNADLVGFISIQGKDRVLDFNPTERYSGKNPAQLEPIIIPNLDKNPDKLFLANIIKRVKDNILSKVAKQQEAVSFVQSWNKKIEETETTVQALNELIKELKQTNEYLSKISTARQVFNIIYARGLAAGFEYDKELLLFIPKKEELIPKEEPKPINTPQPEMMKEVTVEDEADYDDDDSPY